MSEAPAPAVKVEIAFNANFTTPAASRTWTDVSAYQRGNVGVTWGRGDRLNQVEPSSATVILENDGRFTAGNASSPYYPNVKLDRPVRITVTPIGGAASVRFTGYINGWPVEWPLGVDTTSWVSISATSRTGRLALNNALQSMVIEDAIASGAAAVYPCNDPSGSTAAQDASGNEAAPLAIAGSGTPVAFGGDSVEFAAGQYLLGGSPVDPSTGVGFACTFTTTTAPTGVGARMWGAGILTAAQLAPYTDGRKHRLFVRVSSGLAVNATIDDQPVLIKDSTITGDVPLVAGLGFTGTLSDVVRWSTEPSAGDATDDFVAFNGGFGETSDAMLERIAGYASIGSAEVDADAGSVIMGGVDTTGMAVLDALRVVETTEGGTLIDARNGDLRLIGRRARYHTSSTVTLSMADEEIAADYSPTLDRSLLRNDMTGTNAASSVGAINAGQTVSRRAVNQSSVDEYGTAGGSVEVAAADPSEAYSAASWIVANFGEPAPRVPAVTVDLLPLDASRADDVLTLFIGDRFEVTGRPAQDSASSAEFFIEGGTETWGATAAAISWNVSPIGLANQILIFDDPTFGEWDAGYYFAY